MPPDAAIHLSRAQLEAGMAPILAAPREGPVELIVRRPGQGEREVLTDAVLDPVVGLVGDNWLERGSRRTPDGNADPACQITVMASRAISLFAGSRERWALAGDQLFVDADLSEDALPAGPQVRIGEALLEISEKPHTGCPKFVDRFGAEALRFLSTPEGRSLRLRGLNAVVVEGGVVRLGDTLSRT